MNITTRSLFLSGLLLAGACEQHHTLTPEPSSPPALDCVADKSAAFTRPVDLLFVVDNSGSMRDEQASLRAQVPRLLSAFATGDLDDDGSAEFPAVSDLHVGVISTDMGLPNVPNRSNLGCGDDTRRHGDNGMLLTRPDPTVTSCTTPSLAAPFLSWQATDTDADAGDKGVAMLIDEVSCLTTLGTAGCGFEQHLESALVALWPSDNRINGQPVTLDRPFYQGTQGQGAPAGANAGFLRNETGHESLVIVAMLTDENDCSSHDTSHFVPREFLMSSDPLYDVGLNLRCMHAQQNLFEVSRYVDGLKALRPGQEHLVQFVLIAGVPTDLIDPNVDMTNAAARTAYYDAMLNDSRMQEVEDTDPEILLGNPNVVPSCRRPFPDPQVGDPEEQKAYPPRRLVEVARAFGEHGTVQSICQDDFTDVAAVVLKRAFSVLERSSCVKE
jgi:hypothetical protein